MEKRNQRKSGKKNNGRKPLWKKKGRGFNFSLSIQSVYHLLPEKFKQNGRNVKTHIVFSNNSSTHVFITEVYTKTNGQTYYFFRGYIQVGKKGRKNISGKINPQECRGVLYSLPKKQAVFFGLKKTKTFPKKQTLIFGLR